ncbi:4Fe-4S binding protein [Adlercreutzia sp. ZJ473]|uniref:4Fe-4S binding protein n=1 Tax=Adlercreutzia sp. ZJ473 TaxID=2722822 RepID=UPI001557C86C|nr:4Fe-4S binding protein [Adlercreutzia sp. ZJ473]
MERFEAIRDSDFACLRSCEGLSKTEIPSLDDVDVRWCLRFLRAIRDTAFATIGEDGLPSVRVIDVMATDGERLYFLSPRGKAFHEDVMRERFVAIVGQTPDYRTCRLRGQVERIPEGLQHEFVDAFFELNPGMEVVYPDDARYICDVFCIENGEGEYFDLGQKPIFREDFELGGGLAGKTGTFFIGDDCIECGICQRDCPEGCIAPGSPFVIDQKHCIRCGICQEVCPADAVRKRREKKAV